MEKTYKDTLLMPKTDFEMKANLRIKEPLIQKLWEDKNIYKKLMDKNFGKPNFLLHDGPPFANGNIHIGHAMNKVLKDIIVRSKWFSGFYSPYVMGWDTHGLPIEHALLKDQPNLLKQKTRTEFIEMCSEFANKNVKNQLGQFKRLGLCTDYNDIYSTDAKDFKADQLTIFAKMVISGDVYKALKPVYWSWSSQTALAEAEVEYANRKSNSLYLNFKVTKGNELVQPGDSILVWTTTPWTLPSNLAIAFHPKINYSIVENEGKRYIVATNLVNKVIEKLSLKSAVTKTSFLGEKLSGVMYQHCLYNKVLPLIPATYVSDSDGTGLVHNAPGFGFDDYIACGAFNIKPFAPIDSYGKFTSDVNDEELVSKFYEDTNEIIISRLMKSNNFMFCEIIEHSAAHDWRTKKPVIYRATNQWFVNVKKYKEKIISNIENISAYPQWAKNRLISMIDGREEWTISRQRYSGVPITIIYDENNQPIIDKEVFNKIISEVRKNGTNIWYEKDASYFLNSNYDLNKKYSKETDIMDVWFDSGTTYSILKQRFNSNQADLYIEGHDQFRGWFNSSITTSVMTQGISPYKAFFSHGFTLDEKGNKMSKSIGNVIDPLTVCDEFGAEILRLWVANSNFMEDLRIGKNTISQFSESYRKIRNSIFKFILSNINGYKLDRTSLNNLKIEDKYVVERCKEVFSKVKDAYQRYSLVEVTTSLNNLLTELSAWYFETIKDSLYCDAIDSLRRRQIQATLNVVFYTYLVSLTPILPHTCEEAYQSYNCENKVESVMLLDFDFLDNLLNSIQIKDSVNFNKFFEFKEAIYKQIELLRNQGVIGKSIEATVNISTNKSNIDYLKLFNLASLLNVCEVKLIDSQNESISVEHSDGIKCLRCWNIYSKTKMYNEEICNRCAEVINEKKPDQCS
jgi:isoleucyl-tRNA synthetase